MINEFIEKIIVHAPEKIDGVRTVEMEIYLNFVGRIELPPQELTAEEIKKQAQKDRQRKLARERYHRIKAGEWQVGDTFKKECRFCGKTFESKQSCALYCSPNCRTKFYISQADKTRRRECVCENCGTVFVATNKDGNYCCVACKEEAEKQKQTA